MAVHPNLHGCALTVPPGRTPAGNEDPRVLRTAEDMKVFASSSPVTSYARGLDRLDQCELSLDEEGGATPFAQADAADIHTHAFDTGIYKDHGDCSGKEGMPEPYSECHPDMSGDEYFFADGDGHG